MDYSKIYDIDFRALANLLTPPFLRKVTFIDWLEVLFKPLEEVNLSLKALRKEAIYKVTHNGQVVYLQKVLNDSFDKEFRRIKITDSFEVNPTWIYPEADELPVYVYADAESSPRYVYDDSIFDTSTFDFNILIPSDLRPVSAEDIINLELQIKSLTNYYKLASKRYQIKWI